MLVFITTEHIPVEKKLTGHKLVSIPRESPLFPICFLKPSVGKILSHICPSLRTTETIIVYHSVNGQFSSYLRVFSFFLRRHRECYFFFDGSGTFLSQWVPTDHAVTTSSDRQHPLWSQHCFQCSRFKNSITKKLKQKCVFHILDQKQFS